MACPPTPNIRASPSISVAGSTSIRRSSPILAIARETEPTFPELRGLTSTTAGRDPSSLRLRDSVTEPDVTNPRWCSGGRSVRMGGRSPPDRSVQGRLFRAGSSGLAVRARRELDPCRDTDSEDAASALAGRAPASTVAIRSGGFRGLRLFAGLAAHHAA